ncbi:MAG: response regulator [Oscillospiraceae bacterium]|jgi:two-component SAPR family response regulator|nr:Two-component response regulator, SAPR family, consists of REC, wHTH and BTAD domains [Ruminococcaceae bacterium BL-4]
MYRAILVDDERPALDVLSLLLEKSSQICVVGSFTRASDALSEIQTLKPDVAFLDIEMPEISGLELAGKIIEAEDDMEIVFVTAYDKYALEAFRVNAIDYILKPFSSDDIAKVITRLGRIKPLPNACRMPAAQVRICCFGRLSVCHDGCAEALKWRTAKAEELFAFMLQNLNSDVPKWKITQALWPEYEGEKQLNVNLYTTIYKVKKKLLEENIKFVFTFQNGKYRMELPGIFIDTNAFMTITNGEMKVTEASLDKYKTAFGLFKGIYLGENEYYWSQSEAEKYSARYRRLVFALVHYYMEQADNLAAEQTLRDSLQILPLDDDLNEMLLRLFYAKKDKPALIVHYKKIKVLYQDELGIEPSSNMQELFNKGSKL